MGGAEDFGRLAKHQSGRLSQIKGSKIRISFRFIFIVALISFNNFAYVLFFLHRL